MTKPNDPIDVLFIAGYGRSGSTILEQVIARDDAFVSLGEVRHLWQRGYVMNSLCACGEAFQECPFWSEVDANAFGGLDLAEARRMFDLRRSLLRSANIPRLVQAARRRTETDHAELCSYRQRVLSVYRSALATSGASVVLDSSKDPLHGLVLASMPEINLHVLHLVRDARGVAHSMQRPKLRHEVYWKEQRETVRNPARTALVWSYRNVLSAILRQVANTYQLVRYEDFVRKPDVILERVNAQLALEPPTSALKDGRITLPLVHSVSGNANRFEGRDITLRVDDEWRRSLPRAEQLKVDVLASPLLLRYGYLRGRGA